MVPVKCNFSGMYSQENLMCSYGCKIKETQSHILECKYLIEKLPDKSILAEVDYGDLFGEVEEQKIVVQAFQKLFAIKEKMDK